MLKTKTNSVQEQFETIIREAGIEPTVPYAERVARGMRELLDEPTKKTEAPKRKRFTVGKGDTMTTKALECFLNTDAVKMQFGHYFIDGHELYYRSVCTDNGTAELRENLIAKKIGENVIGNSSALGLIGRTSNWGRERLNRGETEVQRRLSLCIPMIPFSVFDQAKLDLDSMQIDARGPEESVTRMRETGKHDKDTGKPILVEETVHFTGASLFTVSGKQFLFDVDRRELKHKIFNAFLVELPVTVNSIPEAYTALKPQAVIDAESKGLEVKRQGEFFFIPVSSLELKRLQGHEREAKTLELRSGPNRPNQGKGIQIYRGGNEAFKGKIVPDMSWQREENRKAWREVKDLDKSVYYFTGKVEHTGREHAALILKGWYSAVPNTAQRSFTITGDVD